MTAEPSIAIRDLTVNLDATPVLSGASLDVWPGEVVALLGENGSGKSTLVRAALGLVPHQAGSIALGGRSLGPGVAWETVGYVPQRAAASHGVPATAGEVVASGLLSAHHLWRPRGWRARVRDALAEVGLLGSIHRPVTELSGGQQQRVRIARALIRQPRIAFLDEPATGLDAASQEAVVTSLAARRDAGMAAVIVLHELGPWAPLITRSVVVHGGRVVDDAAFHAALRSPATPPGVHDPSHPHGDPHHAHVRPATTPRGPRLELEP
jgi:zinc transport system ATP-binding protein